MNRPVPIDAAWCAAHPLPRPGPDVDKNARGRVLAVGGARFVPGALALTGEAVLRSGAGKLQLATVEEVALALAVRMPEAAILPLPMRPDGEIATEALEPLGPLVARADLLLVGPGMRATGETGAFVEGLLLHHPPAVLLDAAALTCAPIAALQRASARTRLLLTPHHGEMARLAGLEEEEVRREPQRTVTRMAQRVGATIALKGEQTWIAGEEGALLHFDGGCPGLATSGSGDVLSGIAGGLVAQGLPPLVAMGWAAHAHGSAGRRAARTIGPFGFLARDLLPLIPRFLVWSAPVDEGRADRPPLSSSQQDDRQ